MTSIALDSSTEVCSAALVQDGKVVAERINRAASNHAALLPTYVQELQTEARERGITVDSIVLSEGPGSYTGLRIGASLAKGLCYGAGLPLYAVPTLAIMAYSATEALQEQGITNLENLTEATDILICPMIDARRMEVYCALYDHQIREVQTLAAVVVDEQSFADLLDKHIIYFCGNGAEKCKTVIKHKNARWIDKIVPTGAAAGVLVEKMLTTNSLFKIVDGKEIAYFEPNYLKEFVAAQSHVKGLK